MNARKPKDKFNLRPLPVAHPYCAICLNFAWEEVERVHHKDITGAAKNPISKYNRYIPLGLCLMRGSRVNAFATCDAWQDDA